MATKLGDRLTYANVMVTIAVFLALGGGAFAAVKLKPNQVKGKHIASGQIATRHFAPGATAPNATNASLLAGLSAGSLQKKCEVGAILGHAKVDASALNGSYVELTTPRFNCAGGQVQGATGSPGIFVKFIGNPAGLAVVSPTTACDQCIVSVTSTTDPNDNLPVFEVHEWKAATASYVIANASFTIVVF